MRLYNMSISVSGASFNTKTVYVFDSVFYNLQLKLKAARLHTFPQLFKMFNWARGVKFLQYDSTICQYQFQVPVSIPKQCTYSIQFFTNLQLKLKAES